MTANIFLSTGANLKIDEVTADLWVAKNWKPIRTKKKFSWLFFCWGDLRLFFKTKFLNFFTNFFFEFFPKLFVVFQYQPEKKIMIFV